MPVLTRSKRKLMKSKDDDSNKMETKNHIVKLMDITNNSKRRKKDSNVVSCKSSLFKTMTEISQQNTVQINVEPPLQVTVSSSSIKSENSEMSEVEMGVISLMRKIKKMMENSFKNVAERLKLDTVPPCLYDLKKCYYNHGSKNTVKIAPNHLKQTTLGYLQAERIFQFIHRVRHNMCGQNFYPSVDILISMFEKMLKLPSATCNSSNDLSTTYVLSEMHNLFVTILDKFPPCLVRDQYYLLFKTPMKIEGIERKDQLFPSILQQLNDLIFLNNDEKRNQCDKNSSIKDIPFNYYTWELNSNENVKFKDLPRTEKFERLFLILDVIVRILEYDTSIFIIKHSHKFATSINNDRIKPLICSVIWKEYESVVIINSTMKMLISIFVAMVALEYPDSKIRIMSRLLTLISNVINMYEYPDETFEYPVYKNYSLDFAREIQRKIENSNYNSLNLYINVTKNIRSPLTRMLLANFLLSKITNEQTKSSLSVSFHSFQNKDFSVFPDLLLKKHRTIKPQIYPCCDVEVKAKKFKICQEGFLQLLLIHAEAVNDFFQISSAIKVIQETNDEDKPIVKQEALENPVQMTFDKAIFKNSRKQLSNEVILRKIDLNFRKMFHIRLTKETCIFYREEMKTLLLLTKVIKRYHEKYGSKYDIWMSFINKIEVEN